MPSSWTWPSIGPAEVTTAARLPREQKETSIPRRVPIPPSAPSLCLQLYQMWRLLECPNPFWVVEAGAGSGLLCRDVVRFAHFPSPTISTAPSNISVWTPSLVTGLKESGNGGGDLNPLTCPTGGYGTRIQPLVTNGLPLAGVVGCILSNELLDAFPVHMVEMRDGRILEVYVTLRDGCRC